MVLQPGSPSHTPPCSSLRAQRLTHPLFSALTHLQFPFPTPETRYEHQMSTRLDSKQIAEAVYALADSDRPLAPLVREALDVIDHTLDYHKCALPDPCARRRTTRR